MSQPPQKALQELPTHALRKSAVPSTIPSGPDALARGILRPCLVDDGKAHSSGGRQAMGEVLHHALQPRAGLECGSGVVLVLGVDKLCDDALRLLQRLRIAVCLEHQLIDVACPQEHPNTSELALSMAMQRAHLEPEGRKHLRHKGLKATGSQLGIPSLQASKKACYVPGKGE